MINYVPGDYGFLYVELAQLFSDSDPGPSSGMRIVGRVRIPLTTKNIFIGKLYHHWFKLVRPTGDGHMVIEGDILLGIGLRMMDTWTLRSY